MAVAILPMRQQYGWDAATVGLVQSSFFWWVPAAGGGAVHMQGLGQGQGAGFGEGLGSRDGADWCSPASSVGWSMWGDRRG